MQPNPGPLALAGSSYRLRICAAHSLRFWATLPSLPARPDLSSKLSRGQDSERKRSVAAGKGQHKGRMLLSPAVAVKHTVDINFLEPAPSAASPTRGELSSAGGLRGV